MQQDDTVPAEIVAVIDEFSAAVQRGDVQAVLNLFGDGDETYMAGSEAGVVARGKPAVAALIRRQMAGDHSYSWRWTSRHASMSGGVAWVAADGMETVHHRDHSEVTPYRLTAVLERRGHRWVFVMFHGSEPVETKGFPLPE